MANEERQKGNKDRDKCIALLLITASEGLESLCVVGNHVRDDWNNAQNLRNQYHHGIRLKRILPKAKAHSGIYASRREIT